MTAPECQDRIVAYVLDRQHATGDGVPIAELVGFLERLGLTNGPLWLVVVESPYAGDVERNERYARACMADSIARGEAPTASHLLYTQPGILDDRDPEQRAKGIACGLAWAHVADAAVFYVDLGMSPGMLSAEARHREAGLPIRHRRLGGEWA